MNVKKLLLATALLSATMSMPAMAGTWQTGAGGNQGKWWYDHGNGSYANNGWQWIDGNGDGIAESYYFDNQGWLLTDTITPDGYTVNADGAWVENSVVQVKTVSESENGNNGSLQLKPGLYEYDHAEIYDTKSGNLVFVGQAFKADGSNYEEVIGELWPYGRPGDPVSTWYIENVDENTLTAVYDIGMAADVFLNDTEYYERYAQSIFKRVYKKMEDKWFFQGEKSDTVYWVIEDTETFKTVIVHTKLDMETSEPTGEVYTEVITYKKIQ